jgi:chloride channel protein, CIC family
LTPSKNLKKSFSLDSAKFSFCLLLTGLSAGLIAFGFHKIPYYIASYTHTLQSFHVSAFLSCLALTFLSLFLSRNFFAETHGSGIPQVKLSLVANKGRMEKRLPFGKFLTSMLTLSSGLSFGKEGPAVTTSASLAHLYAHVFKLSTEMKKLLVITGSAAGLSAAFNTPIAAVTFVIEEILGALNTKYLGPIMICAVIASLTSQKLLDGLTTFVPTFNQFPDEWHFLLYLGLGVVMSLMGILWVKTILVIKEFRMSKLKGRAYLFLFFVVCLVGIASHIDERILGSGISSINQLMQARFEAQSLLILLVLKFFLAALAYSTGLSGGLFMPVLFMGAVGGYGFAEALIYLGVENIDQGSYAILGMTAYLVAVIRIPFTAFVMLFEMTRDYEFILPLMIASASSYLVSSLLSKGSVYEAVALYEGVDLPDQEDHETLDTMLVEECFIQKVTTINAKQTLRQAYEKVEGFSYSAFPVLSQGELYGILSRAELEAALLKNEDDLVSDVCQRDIITIHPDQSLLIAMDKMKRFSITRLPVVSRYNTQRIVGLITMEHIIRHFRGRSSDGSVS